ncbi:MAG TPA: response regulator [Longimicrobiaceae bacterium]|nr:response regulator [Longimicrobiaceae bacterium]
MGAVDPERGDRPTILLLEDDPAVATSLVRFLERMGMRVLLAPTPSAALETAGTHPEHIDLLLSDVVLPEMSGPEAADRIMQIRPGIRVLFMSAYLEADLLDRGEAVFRGDFINKPFELSDLLERIQAILADANR